MTFKDAMNSWNKYRIITVFKGDEIINRTEKIIFILTGNITDITKLNNEIEILKSLTENLKNKLGDIENYAGNNMYNTFIKTPTGKIFDLKKDIYSCILPVCLVNNDNIKDFKEKPSITDKLFSKASKASKASEDGNILKKKELIDMLNKVVDKKTIQKFKFLFTNFLIKIKEEAAKEANAAEAEAGAAVEVAMSTNKEKKAYREALKAAVEAYQPYKKYKEATEAAVKAAEDYIDKEVKDLKAKAEAAEAKAIAANEAYQTYQRYKDATKAIEVIKAAKVGVAVDYATESAKAAAKVGVVDGYATESAKAAAKDAAVKLIRTTKAAAAEAYKKYKGATEAVEVLKVVESEEVEALMKASRTALQKAGAATEEYQAYKKYNEAVNALKNLEPSKVDEVAKAQADKAQAETKFSKYKETFNMEIETQDLNLIHSIMKIYLDVEGEEVEVGEEEDEGEGEGEGEEDEGEGEGEGEEDYHNRTGYNRLDSYSDEEGKEDYHNIRRSRRRSRRRYSTDEDL
jgi:hypothetical protein